MWERESVRKNFLNDAFARLKFSLENVCSRSVLTALFSNSNALTPSLPGFLRFHSQHPAAFWFCLATGFLSYLSLHPPFLLPSHLFFLKFSFPACLTRPGQSVDGRGLQVLSLSLSFFTSLSEILTLQLVSFLPSRWWLAISINLEWLLNIFNYSLFVHQ